MSQPVYWLKRTNNLLRHHLCGLWPALPLSSNPSGALRHRTLLPELILSKHRAKTPHTPFSKDLNCSNTPRPRGRSAVRPWTCAYLVYRFSQHHASPCSLRTCLLSLPWAHWYHITPGSCFPPYLLSKVLIVQIYLVTSHGLTYLVIKEHYISATMQIYVNDSCFK